jgi:hypothetical protein
MAERCRAGGAGGGAGGGTGGANSGKGVLGAPVPDGVLSVTPEAEAGVDLRHRRSPLDYEDAGPWGDEDDGGARARARRATVAWGVRHQAADGGRADAARPSAKPPSPSHAGPSPQQLYGRYTWKIDNFSEISKRELRSNVFEVGSYKWCASHPARPCGATLFDNCSLRRALVM